MFPKEIEIILSRHLASCLAMPMFIIDPSGRLVFYNETAEPILGRRFADTGELRAPGMGVCLLSARVPGRVFCRPTSRPFIDELLSRRPVQLGLWMHGSNGERRPVEITTFPIIGQADRHLGTVAVIWESRGMKVTLWGTRGSLSSPGPDTVRYGGNTSCVEVRGAGGDGAGA